MKRLETWIRPSKRQMISKCVEDLADARKIKTTCTDDGLLWCAVDMTEPPDSVLATLGMILLSWGPPVLIDKGNDEARYLFNPLLGRIRDSLN